LKNCTSQFKITHPFHPKKGKVFYLIDRKKVWGDDRIFYVNENGQLCLIPANFTDAFEKDPFIELSNEKCVTTFDSLMSLMHIVSGLKEQK
jgi:hypothetical protein